MLGSSKCKKQWKLTGTTITPQSLGGGMAKRVAVCITLNFLDKYIKAALKKLGKEIKKTLWSCASSCNPKVCPEKYKYYIKYTVVFNTSFILSLICSFTLEGRDVHNKDSKPRHIFSDIINQKQTLLWFMDRKR